MATAIEAILEHSGTVRSNLDPFSVYDDHRLWDALRRSFLVEDRSFSPDSSVTEVTDPQHKHHLNLDSVIDTEGANLSVGERSLLSLARALVKDARIVILDEATYVNPSRNGPNGTCLTESHRASVDLETDKKIQETVQTQFVDRTLICIARE